MPKESKIKKIGIALRPKLINELTTILPNLITWLNRRKIEVYFFAKDREKVSKLIHSQSKQVNFFESLKEVQLMDLLITLGGDGTLIGVARLPLKKLPPIFGINVGKLGFIAEFGRHNFYDSLEETISGKFSTLKIPLYKAVVERRGKIEFQDHFLNDSVLSKNKISRMLSLSVESNNELIYNTSGDGLIVCSPIGSTAYSLAAGGPIVHPEMKGMIITPVCPHGLTTRPIVVPEKMKLEIRFPGETSDDISLTLDGQMAYPIRHNDRIIISKGSGKCVQLVKNPEKDYFQTLVEKFRYGRRN